jgi:Putative DNA-binding domain
VASTSPGWSIRLRELFGADLSQLAEENLQGLVDGQVREDDDLDFKRERYGGSDSQKREFAADIAAMANHRGGAIVIGLRDENDVAVELTPVEAAGGEEGRLRQVGAGGIAPHVPFEVQVVPSENDAGRVYYVLVVPPSPLRPHAVRKEIDLRYPRRDGTSTRWLAEAEVAGMYRDRFRMVDDQLGRIEAIVEEGLAQMELRADYAYLTVALVPTTPGSMSMGLARIRQIEEWAVDQPGTYAWRGFYGSRPNGRAGIRRVRLGSLVSENRPTGNYSEVYADGAGFACEHVARASREQDEGRAVIQIGHSELLWEVGRALRFLGRHAVENTGACGDAILVAKVSGSRMQLVYPVHGGAFAEPWNHHPMNDPVVTRHTVPLETLVGSDQELLVGTRLVATDLFNAFGAPEVKQIDQQGRLRIRYVREQEKLRAFAEAHGVEVSEETVPGS